MQPSLRASPARFGRWGGRGERGGPRRGPGSVRGGSRDDGDEIDTGAAMEDLGREKNGFDSGNLGEERREEAEGEQVGSTGEPIVHQGPRHGAEHLGQLTAWRQ